METTPAERRAINAHVPVRMAQTLHHAAVITGLEYSLLLAVCEHESAFRNVWGHDQGKFRRDGLVTASDVASYLAAAPSARPNGIGPMQITSPGLQQQAIAHGGLHLQQVTTLVGVRFLHQLVASHGVHDGVRSYNGSGPAAEEYARTVIGLAAHWHTIVTR